jgi:uncharacterized protein involved in outer membrane biogenesis
MKRSRSRIVAVAGFVGIFPALLVAAVLLFEFSVPIDGLRERVAGSLSDALGCPVTIGGSLVLVTGTRPGLEGRDVRLGECRLIRVARASADEVEVRVSLSALLSHEIRLLEITGRRLETEIPTAPPTPAPASTSPGGPSRWTFAGISRLYVAPARLLVRGAGAPPRSIELSEIEGAARADKPMQLTLRGALGQEPWAISAATASLRSALAGPGGWPLDLTATYGEAKLSLHGSWSPTPIGVTGDVEFAAASPEKLFKLLGVDAPELGSMMMSGRLTAASEHIALEAMKFSGPAGEISGDARVTGLGGRPTIDFTLHAGDLDYAALERWRSAAGGAVSTAATFARAVELLRAFDAKYSASIDRVTNAPFSMSDVKHVAVLHAGLLEMTNTATVDGAPSEVSLEIDARGPYAVEGRASVQSLPGTALAAARDLAGIERRIGGLSATFSARGATLEALLKDAHAQLTGKDITLVPPLLGGRREVRLRTIQISAGRGEAVRANAAGTFANEALEIGFVGGSLADLLENRTWAVARLDARIGAARIRANGRIEEPRTARTTKLDVELATSRLDQLGPLLGGTKLPRVPGTLRGSIDYAPDAWSVDAKMITIGATRGSGHLTGRDAAPIAATLDLQSLAGDELAEIGKPSGAAGREERSRALPDLDLSLKARRASYHGQAFENVVLDARARGEAVRAPFSLDWSGAKIDGTLDATLGKKTVRVGGELTARELDLARMPGPLEKQHVDGMIGRLAARIEASGASFAELPAGAAITVEVADTRVSLPRSDALPEGARFTFGGTASAPAGGPIAFSLAGTFRDKPIKLAGRLPPLDALYPAGKPYALQLTLDYDRTRLEAEGTATIDNDAPKFSGLLKLSGDTLHTLADLAGFSARGFGPYAVSANVEADSAQVSAQDVAVKLGKSRFLGSLASTPGKLRPHFTAKVSGSPVHLEDIGAQALSPQNLEAQARVESQGKNHGGVMDEAKLDRDARMLTRVLRAFDFDVDMRLDELSAAGEAIGRAELKANLADGVLKIKPLSLTVGEGTFDAEIDVDVRGKMPRYALRFESNRVDYGPLLRAVDPQNLATGTFDLSLDVKSSGAPERLVQNATGAVDILVLPKNQQAGRLDALGAGVLRLVMTTLDPRDDSRLNCIVGSFDLANGFATSRIVLLDTTRARVAGELTLDFETHGLNGRLAPQSKRPELFSVVPGISISGTLDAPRVGITATQVVVGMLNIWKVPLTFTAGWLTNRDLPADGTPDCRAAYRSVLH